VHSMMSQLGTRLLFYEVPADPPTEPELLDYAEGKQERSAQSDCSDAVESFCLEFFSACPIASVLPESITMTETQTRDIVKWARFLVAARAAIKSEKDGSNWKAFGVMPSEGPWKIITYLLDLARGHALVCGRNWINQSDLNLVAHTAISSVPNYLREMIRQLSKQSTLDTEDIARSCRVSRRTGCEYIQHLSLLGIADLFQPNSNQCMTAVLREDYHWLFDYTL
jgi:hypothetical protein